MNCEQCQELISAFLDNDLDDKISSSVQTHLSICAECAKLCEDFAVILNFCHEETPAEIVPPNPQALWCRINNVIESEIKQEFSRPEAKSIEAPKSRLSKMWQLSLSQFASAMMVIALLSSLLTIVVIKNYSAQPASGSIAAQTDSQPGAVEKVLAKFGLVETPQQIRLRRIQQQQAAIDYWNQRVAMRRMQWDNNLRDAFDRNLNEIDRTVSEYTLILQENPQDDLSGEMLDSTLTEKMELLREFSDL